MNTHSPTTSERQTVINGLAVVGFIALVVFGVWLAIYSTRFVPTVVNRIGAAATYLGSVFIPAPKAGLSVVPTSTTTPTASTTISFGTSTTTNTGATTTPTTPSHPRVTPPAQPVLVPVTPHGLSDLAISESVTGYLTSDSTDSFVASRSVPHNDLPAVKFLVANIGTNYSGAWRFSADIPLSRSVSASGFESCESLNSSMQRCTSFTQQSLAPGESILYTLGFDHAKTGSDQPLSITIDPTNVVSESIESNNQFTSSITVL